MRIQPRRLTIRSFFFLMVIRIPQQQTVRKSNLKKTWFIRGTKKLIKYLETNLQKICLNSVQKVIKFYSKTLNKI